MFVCFIAGKLVSETNFLYWAPNQPSTLFGMSFENCCCMRRNDNWKWHDYHCDLDGYAYNFICQYRKLATFVINLINVNTTCGDERVLGAIVKSRRCNLFGFMPHILVSIVSVL